MARKSQQSKHIQKSNFWGMIQSVLIASMSKGQLVPILFALIVFFCFYKMPATDVSKVFLEFLSLLKNSQIMGYLLAGFILVLWFFHSKYQRKINRDEINRNANEKTKLQSQMLGGKIESSEE